MTGLNYRKLSPKFLRLKVLQIWDRLFNAFFYIKPIILDDGHVPNTYYYPAWEAVCESCGEWVCDERH